MRESAIGSTSWSSRAVGVLITALAAMVMAPVGAESGVARLEQFFKDVQGLRANFIQLVVGSDGAIVEQTRGELMLQRPGKFRWHYQAPFEQLIVADGQRIWVYDPDLEQVTVRAQNDAMTSTPAQLLSGAALDADQFVITELGEEKGRYSVRLEPRDTDAGFKRAEIIFKGEQISALRVVDGFDNVTEITFSDLERNPRFGRGTFQFKPPAGVDVIGE